MSEQLLDGLYDHCDKCGHLNTLETTEIVDEGRALLVRYCPACHAAARDNKGATRH
jgi:hypothetical protein